MSYWSTVILAWSEWTENGNHVLAAGALILLAFALFHSILFPDSGDEKAPATWLAGSVSISVFVDPEYGCHYLASHRGGIAPRLDQDGEHICGGES